LAIIKILTHSVMDILVFKMNQSVKFSASVKAKYIIRTIVVSS